MLSRCPDLRLYGQGRKVLMAHSLLLGLHSLLFNELLSPFCPFSLHTPFPVQLVSLYFQIETLWLQDEIFKLRFAP
jgi:hypothetical protein